MGAEYKPQALATFVSDDGEIEDLLKLKPLFDKKGIRGVSSIPINKIGLEGFMTLEQIDELKNAGWEIASHGLEHKPIGYLTEEEAEREIGGSMEFLKKNGYDCTSIVYPSGSFNVKFRNIVAKYYRSGIGTQRGVNYSPINTWQLKRISIGSYFDGVEKNKFDYYKSRVDEAISKKGWIIFMLHPSAREHDDLQQKYLEQTIDYCINNNLKVVTLKEGLDLMGNNIKYGNDNFFDNRGYYLFHKVTYSYYLLNKLFHKLLSKIMPYIS